MKTQIHLNHSDIIKEHAQTVRVFKEACGDKNSSDADLAKIERQVSQLGQVFNRRISAKSLKALNEVAF